MEAITSFFVTEFCANSPLLREQVCWRRTCFQKSGLFMLSIARIKQILNDSKISDEEAELIRDGFRNLVEDIIFESWVDERNKIKQKQHEK